MRRVSPAFRITLPATACVLALTACGSSSNPKASSGRISPLAFSQCMRAHGLKNFPDPKAGGGGIQLNLGSGIDPFSPAFKSAQASCKRLLPGGGPGAGHPSAQAKAQMLQISQCMRAHGITNFPDPTLSPPNPPAGHTEVLGRDGVFLAIPSTIDPRSPAFKRAAAACRFPG
jgi:hypothetical protein